MLTATINTTKNPARDKTDIANSCIKNPFGSCRKQSKSTRANHAKQRTRCIFTEGYPLDCRAIESTETALYSLETPKDRNPPAPKAKNAATGVSVASGGIGGAAPDAEPATPTSPSRIYAATNDSKPPLPLRALKTHPAGSPRRRWRLWAPASAKSGRCVYTACGSFLFGVVLGALRRLIYCRGR